MLDVKDSVNRLAWTTGHHFLHIQARHDFMRAWAVQFEMAYTDFRVIQMALQLGGEQYHDLLKRFAAAYEAVYAYEYAFAAGGLAGFDEQFADKMADYQTAEQTLLKIIDEIKALQPA